MLTEGGLSRNVGEGLASLGRRTLQIWMHECREVRTLASPFGGGVRAQRGRRGSRATIPTLSVSFADSSPKGRARELPQIATALKRNNGRGKPLPYITTKRAAARKYATLLLIRRFAPPSPHGEGWGYLNSSSTAWMLGSVHVGCTPYFSQSAATPSPERTNTVSMPAFLPQAMSV